MAFLRRGFLKSANRRNELYCRIDASGVAGVFVFLLFLLIVATPRPSHGVGVDLPVVTHPRSVPSASREDAIRVAITRDGSVFFRNTKIVPDKLPNAIRGATLNGAEKKVYLVVDARAHYGDLKALLPEIQLAGIENVCFLTERDRTLLH